MWNTADDALLELEQWEDVDPAYATIAERDQLISGFKDMRLNVVNLLHATAALRAQEEDQVILDRYGDPAAWRSILDRINTLINRFRGES
jgi:hypothetical protein